MIVRMIKDKGGGHVRPLVPTAKQGITKEWGAT